MNSVDTNVLLHALDEEAAGHKRAYAIYDRLMKERDSWVLADQTLFELYRALRNPAVCAEPLSAARAIEQIEFLRSGGAALHCGYEAKLWPNVVRLLLKCPDRGGLLVFDAILAATLHAHGVTCLYTRNVRDFESFGFFEVIDPLEA